MYTILPSLYSIFACLGFNEEGKKQYKCVTIDLLCLIQQSDLFDIMSPGIQDCTEELTSHSTLREAITAHKCLRDDTYGKSFTTNIHKCTTLMLC